jgi:hypothetical protein
LQGKVSQITCVLATLAFAMLAFSLMVREYRSFYSGAGIEPIFYITAPDAFAVEPFGLKSIAREIELCFKGIEALSNSILDAETRKSGLERCLFLAERTLARVPSHGAALQLKSETLYATNERESARKTLIAAAQAAPNTAWLAQRRIMLALEFAPQMGSDLAGAVDVDIQNLLKNDLTNQWMAQVYVQNEKLHSLISKNEGKIQKHSANKFIENVKIAYAAQEEALRAAE